MNVTISDPSPVVGNLSVAVRGGCSRIYTRQPCVEVTAEERPGSNPVETNLAITGFAARQAIHQASIQLEIPIDVDIRKARTKDYIEKLAADGASRSDVTQTKLTAFGNLSDWLAKYLSSAYSENRVGLFSVGCTYVRPGGSGSSASVTSTPIVVEFQNNGTFFDQPPLVVGKAGAGGASRKK